MLTYDETKDPSETKDYTFDWNPKLSVGETLSGSPVVAFISAAGTTNPSNTVAAGITRVWLAGGAHGSRAIYTIQVATSGGRTLEEAFAVDVVDTVLGATGETAVERLTRQITEAEAQRHLVALGQAVVEVWRDGRRVVRKIPSMADLNAHIDALRLQLDAANVVAGLVITTLPRRRFIPLAFG